MEQGKLADAPYKHIFFEKYIGVLLLLITLIVGLFTYKDYGISWDEPMQRYIVHVSDNYVLHGNTFLYSFMANEYGVAYEMPLILLEKIFHLTDTRDIYLLRHLVNHLFFLFSAFIFFLLIDYLYKNKLLAAIGFLLLVVNPLIYGHSFINSKDVPFLSLFIICFMLAALAFDKYTYKHFIALGVACGLLTDMRLLGVLLIGVIGLFFIIDLNDPRNDAQQRRKIRNLLYTFIVATLLVIYAAWPYLWTDPLDNFFGAFLDASNPFGHYRHDHDEVLFNGQVIHAQQLPRYYIIVWFLIANPPVYLAMGFFGALFFIFNFCKNYKLFFYNSKERNNLLYLYCFAAPLLLVVAFHTVVYDSWRQYYFVYPPFILLAIYGLNKLVKTKAKAAVLTVVVAGIGFAGYYIISNYPFGYVYFNPLVSNTGPEQLRKNWEMEYWGTSFKQAYDYILKNDASANIYIAVDQTPGIYNYMILKPKDRKRIHFLDPRHLWNNQFNPLGVTASYADSTHQADYFVTIYRYHYNDYPYSPSQVYYSIKVLNSSILTVYKLK